MENNEKTKINTIANAYKRRLLSLSYADGSKKLVRSMGTPCITALTFSLGEKLEGDTCELDVHLDLSVLLQTGSGESLRETRTNRLLIKDAPQNPARNAPYKVSVSLYDGTDKVQPSVDCFMVIA